VVNDSILLVTFIKNRMAEGMDVALASQTASRERFRAVLLISITTIVGLIPLLSETSLSGLDDRPDCNQHRFWHDVFNSTHTYRNSLFLYYSGGFRIDSQRHIVDRNSNRSDINTQ